MHLRLAMAFDANKDYTQAWELICDLWLQKTKLVSNAHTCEFIVQLYLR